MLSEIHEVSFLSRGTVRSGGALLCSRRIHIQTLRAKQRTADLLRFQERICSHGEQDSIADDQCNDGKRRQLKQRRHDDPAQEHLGDLPRQQYRHWLWR